MSAFIPTILTELGYTSALAQVMSIPVWVTGIVFQIFGCWVAGRIGWRSPFIFGGIMIASVGWIIQVVYSESGSMTAGVRYFSLFALSAGTFLQMALSMSWAIANVRGRAGNAVATALIYGIGNCANFVAPNVFIRSQSPTYPTGFRAGLAITLVGAATCVVYVAILLWHNKKLDKKRSEYGGEDDQTEYKYSL